MKNDIQTAYFDNKEMVRTLVGTVQAARDDERQPR
jgi:hypothetical protein